MFNPDAKVTAHDEGDLQLSCHNGAGGISMHGPRQWSFLALLIGLFLIGNLEAGSSVRSVMPLTTVEGKTFCTAFSINEQEHLWGTAGHCAAYALQNEIEMRIGGDWAKTVFVWFDNGHDLAVIQAGVSAQALQLADGPAKVGQDIEVRGFPYGLPEVRTQGHVGARNVPIEGVPVSDILDLTVAPGNSGSPVLRKGRVVGILWGRFNFSEHSLSIPWEALRQHLSTYWEAH